MAYLETSVSNDQSVPRNVPEEWLSHLQGRGSLNSSERGEVFQI